MFSYLIISFCCSFFVVTFRRKVIKRIQDHENPKIQGIERIPIHSPLFGFTSDVDARNFVMQGKCSPYVQYLDGNWLFYLHSNFHDALTMLGRGAYASTSHLVPCNVPCQWQLLHQGDPPISTNIPLDSIYMDNPAGYFQCNFEIPEEWKQRQIRLIFGGVGSAFYVWINGNFVGFSKDSKLSTEYNITQYSKIGRGNLLELIVVKFSDGSHLENHGSWKFSGIFREVYIMSLPQAVHIQDYNWFYLPKSKSGIKKDNRHESHKQNHHKIKSSGSSSSNTNKDGDNNEDGYNDNDYEDDDDDDDDQQHQQRTVTVKIQLEWDAPSSSDSLQNQKHNFGHFQGGIYPRYNFMNSSTEWIVSTALYEEGVMMSSSPVESFDSAQYFAFHKPKSHPTAKCRDSISRPSASSHDKFTTPSSSSSRDDEQNQEDEPTLHSFTSLPQESNPVTKKWLSEITHHLTIKSAHEWSAEKPFVYTLIILLRNATDGRIVQAESCRVALRSVDVKDGLLRVNDKPIMIRGTNILEYDCNSGNSIPHSLCELDIQHMKRNNINAIRTPPHDPWLYELCTLYGIYVVNEVNIQPHFNSLRVVDDPDWEIAYLTRLIRLYGRDKIHSSIIIWSLGNRSGYGKIHDKMAHWLRATDPTRLVMYEPASYGARNNLTTSIQNRQMATDILCPMYAQITDLITLANRYPDHPLILSEYSLMTGNSGGNIEEYWHSFNNYRRLQGGFLSNWIDYNFKIQTQPTSFWSWHESKFMSQLKAVNSQLFSGVNWHDRGQISDSSHNVDDIQELIPYGLVAQSPHSGYARARELQEMGRISVKPQLLEVKQCMKLFDCEIIETKFSEVLPDSFLVTLTIHITNLTDHVKDLSQFLSFDGYLLCNGVLISLTHYSKLSSLTIAHVGDNAAGRKSYQLMVGICEFIVPLQTTKESKGQQIFGIKWPEDLLSIPTSNACLRNRILNPKDRHHISLDIKHLYDWKVVVLGRLASHMSWGSAGLPLGFKQMKFDKFDKLSWEFEGNLESQAVESDQHAIEIRWIQGEAEKEPNILLRAEKQSSHIEAVISSQTGYLLSYRVNNVDILDNQHHTNLPSRFQLHRAPTAIDHKGYLPAWSAVGLDKEMHHIAHNDINLTNPLEDSDVLGHSNLRLIQVDRIYLHQRDDTHTELEDPQSYCGEGIMCTWETTSDSMERGHVLILDKVQKFVNDSSSRMLIVEVRSNEQESFLYQLASLFRLGKEIVLSKEEELAEELARDWNTTEMNQQHQHHRSQPKESLQIRLWKMTSIPTSTIPYIEGRLSQPTGSLKHDVIDSYDNPHCQLSQLYFDHENKSNEVNKQQQKEIDFSCRQHFTVKWKVSYLFDYMANFLIRGEVDISSLPCPPARIGLQLTLQNKFDSCCWFGNGPHENYQDRKASTVCAIHSTSCKSLHVPYTVPSENGGRSNTQWIEFYSNSKSNLSTSTSTSTSTATVGASSTAPSSTSPNPTLPRIRIRCNPLCTFSAQRYSTEELMTSMHTSELSALSPSSSPSSLCVNIDPYMMALGSDDCWSIAMADKLILTPKVYNFQLMISSSFEK